jgi:hypothetical protein
LTERKERRDSTQHTQTHSNPESQSNLAVYIMKYRVTFENNERWRRLPKPPFFQSRREKGEEIFNEERSMTS